MGYSHCENITFYYIIICLSLFSVLQGLIYIVGGCTHSRRHMQELVSYNPVQIVLELEITSTDDECLQVTNEWTTLASMLVPRSQMGCVVLNEFLYVLGGTNRHNEVLQVGQQTSRGVIGTLRKFSQHSKKALCSKDF